MRRALRDWLVREGQPRVVEQRPSIVIVGAGMAGASLALALRPQGYAVTLVEGRSLGAPAEDDKPGVDGYDRRVSAITPASRDFLDEIGVWAGIASQRNCAYQTMSVWDGEGTAEIVFDAAEMGVDSLGVIVENRVIMRSLLAAVTATNEISVLDNTALTAIENNPDDKGVGLVLGDTAVRADLVVAADGALSAVRQLAGFSTREWDYGHNALVATVALEKSHQNTAWQRFTRHGPLAFLPLSGTPDCHLASIVWSSPPEYVDDLMGLGNTQFCAQLGHAFEYRLGQIESVSSRACFPLRQRHAVDYVQPGIALVADAAHTIHPLAGQGINLGFKDVCALAAELGRARELGLSPGAMSVLRRYQRQRKGDNLLMMAAMDGFKLLFGEQTPALTLLRNTGMNWLQDLAPVKHRIMKHAMGLG